MYRACPTTYLSLISLIFIVGCSKQQLSSGAKQGDASTATRYRFTHSEVELSQDWEDVIQRFETSAMHPIQQAGGKLFAIWHSIPLEEGGPAPELSKKTLIVTIAWPEAAWTDAVSVTDGAISDFAATNSVGTRLFDPVVLPNGMTVSTGQGFYVHRLNQYPSKDVDRVSELSQEAWRLMERAYGEEHSVIGLFREVPDQDGVSTLMRIVWYPSFEAWQVTRGAKDQVPEAIEIFEERGTMAIGNPFGEATITGLFTNSNKINEQTDERADWKWFDD